MYLLHLHKQTSVWVVPNVIIIHVCNYFLGQPVAWALSDKEDADTLECFTTLWAVIKRRCPNATLMTDDGMFFEFQRYNPTYTFSTLDLAGVLSCARVYPGMQHLLCKWHVDR